MKALMIYESSDGCRFNTADDCLKYEQIAAAVADAMTPLGKRESLGNGKWIQHERDNCLQAKRGLVAICRMVFKGRDFPVFNNDPDEIHPCSAAGRIINDCGPNCLDRAWNRLMCINWDNFREYDQPFFALHPEEAAA